MQNLSPICTILPNLWLSGVLILHESVTCRGLHDLHGTYSRHAILPNLTSVIYEYLLSCTDSTVKCKRSKASKRQFQITVNNSFYASKHRKKKNCHQYFCSTFLLFLYFLLHISVYSVMGPYNTFKLFKYIFILSPHTVL